MTSRKKKGIGLIVSGVVSATAGAVLIGFTTTPDWLGVGITIVSAVCSTMSIYFIAPDTSDD